MFFSFNLSLSYVIFYIFLGLTKWFVFCRESELAGVNLLIKLVFLVVFCFDLDQTSLNFFEFIAEILLKLQKVAFQLTK